MKKYIGVKLIEAKPMKLGAYNEFKSWPMPSDEDPEKEGYLVVYPDGYKSWSPKEIFESSHLQIGDDNTVTQRNVDHFIDSIHVEQFGEKTTVVHAKLVNGYVITETSSSVDPANFNLELGAKIARGRIEESIWQLLGFLLQCGFNGFKKK